MQDIRFIPATQLKAKPTDESKLGFGQLFTDYMFIMNYNPTDGWTDARVQPYQNFDMDPACLVLHYGQTIFEGLKAYRRADGGIQLFRPRDNFRRMNKSADRLCIPQFDVELAMAGLEKLLEVEKDWVPHSEGASLYIRPTIIATDVRLGVHASNTYAFYIILSPSGAYYASGLDPVGIYVEDQYVRAVRGGMGFAKTAGNYAASIKAGEVANEKGYAQVLWLDGIEHKYVEEVGSMNMMFKIAGRIVTPMLNGSILAGITRDSIMTLARDMGVEVEERRVAIKEVFDAAEDGTLEEAFGTGTAAVVSPVNSLCMDGKVIRIGDGSIGPLTQKLYDTLTGIQYGRLPDPHNWIVKL
ncbi:MAG TPA: branched-chain amino acid aminotransferase [Candidatus Fimadaptatus faecigallinarum]|uniref:branched-chain-amino-acid transaminase n=1 Tax=Candidatus Fimadaptatus faecigallinarum TaxID=2840814 RepID=A0A9D1S4D0_9FIRM|nr:branched-chain amino acid aminotransferase [Candidatus Fimadaptatus faecigallinarum]